MTRSRQRNGRPVDARTQQHRPAHSGSGTLNDFCLRGDFGGYQFSNLLLAISIRPADNDAVKWRRFIQFKRHRDAFDDSRHLLDGDDCARDCRFAAARFDVLDSELPDRRFRHSFRPEYRALVAFALRVSARKERARRCILVLEFIGLEEELGKRPRRVTLLQMRSEQRTQ